MLQDVEDLVEGFALFDEIDGLGNAFENADADSSSGWQKVTPDEANISVEVDVIASQRLDNVKEEFSDLADKAERAMRDFRCDHVADIYFRNHSPFLDYFSQAVSRGLGRCSFAALEAGEEYQFLQMLCLMHFFQKSVEVVYESSAAGLFLNPLPMSKDRFKEILKAIGTIEPVETSSKSPGQWQPRFSLSDDFAFGLEAFKNVNKSLFTLKECCTISIDDDKLQLRSKTVGELTGLQQVYREGYSAGPIFFSAVSANTNFILCTKPFEFNMTKESVINDILESIGYHGGSFGGAKSSLNGAEVSLDRGMATPSTVSAILERNGHIIGTSTVRGSPFRIVDSKKGARTGLHSSNDDSDSGSQAAHTITRTGCTMSAWSEKSFLRDNGPIIQEMAYRAGGGSSSVVLALTSKPLSVGCGAWQLETSAKKNNKIIDLLFGENEDVEPLYEHYTSAINVMLTSTCRGGAEWFCLRRFRLTGVVAFHAFSALSTHWYLYKDSFPTGYQDNIKGFFLWLGMVSVDIEPPLPSTVNVSNKKVKLATYDEVKNLTVVQLRQMCKDKSITKISALNRADLIHVLTGSPPPPKSVVAVLLESWLSLSSKGSLGHTLQQNRMVGLFNEGIVLEHIGSFVEHYQQPPSQNDTLHFLSVRQVGLLACRKLPYLAASLDGLAVVRLGEDEVLALSVEIKTKLSGQEVQKSYDLRSRQGHVQLLRISPSRNNCATLHSIMPHNKSYIAQVMHQSCVLDLDGACYVEATGSSIIRIVVLLFPPEWRAIYRQVLMFFYEHYFPWTFSGDINDKDVDFREFGGELDRDSLFEQFCLSKKLFAKVIAQGHEMPHCARLVPSLVASWNKAKTGVDTITRLSDNVSVPFHVSPPASLWLKLVLSSFLNCFSVTRALKYKTLPVAQQSASIESLRNAIESRVGSFSDYVLALSEYFASRHSRPSALSQPAAVEASVAHPFQPPSKHSHKNMKLQAFSSPEGVVFRKSGVHLPLEAVHDNRRRCFICDKKTKMECACCDVALCIKQQQIGTAGETGIHAQEEVCWSKFHSRDNLTVL